MKFSLLGSIEVTDFAGRDLRLGGTNQRVFLAYLVLNANSVVPTSRIMQAMWRGDPPPTARKMVQNAVSSIRQMFNTYGHPSYGPTLQTLAPGYQLRTDADSIDLFEFRRLVRQGRAAIAEGDPERGGDLLRLALSMWRGQALADLVETGIQWSEISAIEEERQSALEDRIDADLSCGRHREITAELELATRNEPLRERLSLQYMLALYRSGRQADALGVYHRTRQALVEELGIEPCLDLQSLHQRILVHDPVIQPRVAEKYPAL